MRIEGGKHMGQGPSFTTAAVVHKIDPGGVIETLGEVHKGQHPRNTISFLCIFGITVVSVKLGDIVLEWNGVSLVGKSHEAVTQIVSQPAEEVEVLIQWSVHTCMPGTRQSCDS